MNGRVFRRGKTWSYVVDVGAHGDGRRRQRMKGGFATKRDADRALREVLRTLDTGTYVAASSLTLGGFLADEWLPAMRPPTLRATTWTEYARKVRCHVIPRLGQIPLQRLSPAHLNAFYAELITAGRVDGTGGLSPKTVREIHVIVRKALKDAVRWGRVNRNVAALADPPSQRSAVASRRRTMRTWTPAQLRRFLSEDLDERLGYAWVLAGTTGLRRSELLGLRWADVDLTAARLAVRQRLANVDGHPELSEPKSNRSGRVVDLDERTVAALRARRTQQAEHRLMCGPAWHDLDLVVTREDGLWIHPDWFSELFRRRVAALGLPKIRLHDLRHTHATLLLQAGVNAKIVSERLGHHSVAFTLDTYAHVIPGMQSDAVRRLSALIDDPAADPSREHDATQDGM
ncbi:MAG: site-specific integrase [Actinobacteria bacterium]|nr:site-specific integrase [Actinomycetota bacterium]